MLHSSPPCNAPWAILLAPCPTGPIHDPAESVAATIADLVPADRTIRLFAAGGAQQAGPTSGAGGEMVPLLAAAARVHDRDPAARILVAPLHFGTQDAPGLVKHLLGCYLAAQRFPDRIVLLTSPGPEGFAGLVPATPTPPAAWGPLPVRAAAVRRSAESVGTLAWTGVLATRAGTLLERARELHPEVHRHLETLRRVRRAIAEGRAPEHHERLALERLVDHAPGLTLLDGLLRPSVDRLLLLHAPDLGREEAGHHRGDGRLRPGSARAAAASF